MSDTRVKPSRCDEERYEDERSTKAKRHDIEISTADVDIKLAEKLDNCLKIGGVSKPRFLTNKTRDSSTGHLSSVESTACLDIQDKIKPKNLTKDELKLRLIKKYDSLVPELDPQRHNVKVVKILTANESIEMGKAQAKKQLERQMELNSVSGNQSAIKNGMQSFRFSDGYEMPMSNLKLGRKQSDPARPTKSVKFADDAKLVVTCDELEDTDGDSTSDSCTDNEW